MLRHALAAVLISTVTSCSRAPAAKEVRPAAPASSYAPAEVPPELAAEVERADAAIGALQQTLAKRLLTELERAGAEGALDVCRVEAQTLTADVAKEHAVEVGRTSHRLRNPRNAPRPWAQAHVAAAGPEAGPRVFDLGSSVGVLRPIYLGGVCLQCHGPDESIAPALRERLARAYPEDRARGFAEGALRGYFWAEVSRAPAP